MRGPQHEAKPAASLEVLPVRVGAEGAEPLLARAVPTPTRPATTMAPVGPRAVTWCTPLRPARRGRRLGQAGTLVRQVMDDAARGRLIGNVTGHLLNGVTEPVLVRAFQYWTNVDVDLGRTIEESVRTQQKESAPTTSQAATTPADEAAEK